MKKIILSVLTMLLFFSSFAQKNGRVAAECPTGTYPVIIIEITTFNFHKPRTDCESGFGLCIRGVFSASCQSSSNYRYDAATKIENNKVYSWGQVSGGKLELHIPVEIKSYNRLSEEDASTFEIEDAALTVSVNGRTFTTKQGKYNTELRENDLVVFIDLQ